MKIKVDHYYSSVSEGEYDNTVDKAYPRYKIDIDIDIDILQFIYENNSYLFSKMCDVLEKQLDKIMVVK